MLSFKVTYAIQILDMLRGSDIGRSIADIRDHFSFLPTRAFVAGLVRQMETGRLICNTSLPGTCSRYRIMVGFGEVTLYDLSHIVDGALVMGAPIGFRYWSPGYLNTYPHIKEVEQQLESRMREFMESVTIEDILVQQEQAGETEQAEQIEQTEQSEQKSQRAQTVPRKRRQRRILTAE